MILLSFDICQLKGCDDSKEHSWVNSVAFSEDDMKIVSGSDDRTVRVWDVSMTVALSLRQEHSFVLIGHTEWISSVAFPETR